MIESLLVITFALHVIPMNVALGGMLVAAACATIGRLRGSQPHELLAGKLLACVPAAVAMTITFGIPPLLFAQVRYTHDFLTAALTYPWPWIAVPAILAAGYAASYRLASRPSAALAWLTAMLFVTVGGIFSIVIGRQTPPIAGAARFAHMLVGSTAIGALFAALVGRRVEWMRVTGCRLFGFLTIVQMGVGVWFLLSIPQRDLFLGGRALNTAVLWTGIGFAVCALGAAFTARPMAAAALIVPTIFTMSWARHLLRDWTPQPVATGPAAIFFVCLAAAIGLLVWMVWRAA